MNPNLPIATDNIYKFACLFGLALIIASIISFADVYSAGVDKKIKLNEGIIAIEGKIEPTSADKKMLKMYENIIDVTKVNESFVNSIIGVVFSLGAILSGYGARRWLKVIQVRDDLLAEAQHQKLQVEIDKLKLECEVLRGDMGKSAEQNISDMESDGT